MSLYEARWTVAYRLLWHAADKNALAEYRKSFPEIGLDDWERIVTHAHNWIDDHNPNDSDYQEAYGLLAERAKGQPA